MKPTKVVFRWLVTLVITAGCFLAMGGSADAFWRWRRHHFRWHHRHHLGWHHRHHRGWHRFGYRVPLVSYAPLRYRTYGWHHGWRHRRPVYYRPYSCWNSYGGYGGLGGYYGYLSSDAKPSSSLLAASTAESQRHTSLAATDPVVNQSEAATPRVAPVGLAETSVSTRKPIELNVEVPEDASVFINGMATKAAGTRRVYLAEGASMDDEHVFVVRAEMEVGGRMHAETKEVRLRGGQHASLAFQLPDATEVATDEVVDTTLTLRVPRDAQVYLAGYSMKQTGPTRVFQTKELRPGEKLEDYTVRVTWERDGQFASRVKKLTLVGGATMEIEFDFSEATRLAAR